MPELPEVETIARELRPHVEGRTILDTHVDWARIIAHPQEDVERFCTGVRGRQLTHVWRRAKFVVMDLDDGQHILVHLRMSGRLVLSPNGLPQHLRIAFKLSEGGQLYFYCQRKFGQTLKL